MTTYYYADNYSPGTPNYNNKSCIPTMPPKRTPAPDVSVRVHQQHPDEEYGKQKWSWCTTAWSLVSLGLGMFWCGLMGLVCSLAAYTDHQSLEYDDAGCKRKWAWGFSIAGVVCFILIIIVIIVCTTVLSDDSQQFLCDYISDEFCD